MSEMAAERPLLVLHDPEEGHLVYDLLLFESGQGETVACLPHPAVARFPLPSWCCSLAVSGGSVVCAQYDWQDTLFHDTVMLVGGYKYFEKRHGSLQQFFDSEGRLVRWGPMCRGFGEPRELPDSHKNTPAMLPMRDGTVIRIDTLLFNGIYNVETLRRLPDDGTWHATPLPKPPIGRLPESPLVSELALLSAYFSMGTRVWISVERKGTFSLDTADGGGAAWRQEGTWQLPFEGRALYVPELDSVFGFNDQCLCACDIKGTGEPPVMRYVWGDTFPRPSEPCVIDSYGHQLNTRPRDLPSLAYLGKGRFCICRPMSTMEPRNLGPQITYNGSSLLVVEVKRLPDGELQLAKRGKMNYMWLPQARECRYIGLIQPAI